MLDSCDTVVSLFKATVATKGTIVNHRYSPKGLCRCAVVTSLDAVNSLCALIPNGHDSRTKFVSES